MASRWKLPLAGLLCAAGALAFSTPPAQTADHRDAPGLNTDPGADINDVYAFRGGNGNIVLAMTVNPFTVPGIGASFAPDVLYQFKIDSNGDAKEDLVIQATFSKASTTGSGQTFTLRGPAVPGERGATNGLLPSRGVRTTAGAANGTVVSGPDGIKVFAGLREDPFFFDFVKITRILGITSGTPPERPAVDFFAGVNVSVLAVELPASLLRPGADNKIGVWGTTSRRKQVTQREQKDHKESGPFIQVERMGFPVVNTVLIGRAVGTSSRKDLFNRSGPLLDRRHFRSEAVTVLQAINGNFEYSSGIANALLPDMLPLDVTSSNGFSMLNGRRPEDDVIDTVLSLASNGAVTTDGVNANDKAFLQEFPYFAPPFAPEDGVPPRN